MISLCIFFLAIFPTLYSTPVPKQMIDLTHPFDNTTMNAPIYKKFVMHVLIKGMYNNEYWLQFENFATGTHCGTHMHSPAHFVKGGKTIDQIDVSRFVSPLAVIDITDKAGLDPDAYVTVDDLQKWESDTGSTLDGTVILLRTGWCKRWTDPEAYFGTSGTDLSKFRFPGLDPEAARWLVDKRKAHGIGIDTVSYDRGISTELESHRILLGAGYFGLENVACMDEVPIHGATLYAMPLKVGRASGAPARLIVTVPDDH